MASFSREASERPPKGKAVTELWKEGKTRMRMGKH